MRATSFFVVNHSRIDLTSQDKLGSPFASVEYIDIDTGRLCWLTNSSRLKSNLAPIMSENRKSTKSVTSSTYSADSKSTNIATIVSTGTTPKQPVKEVGGNSSGTYDELMYNSADSYKARREENAKAKKRREAEEKVAAERQAKK